MFIDIINGLIDGMWNGAGIGLLILAAIYPFFRLYVYLERKENE